MTGSVLGMQTMVVTPPAAAARLAVAERLAVLVPGLAGEDHHVDEAGGEHVAAAVDDLGLAGSARVDMRPEIGDRCRPAISTPPCCIEAGDRDRSAAH